MSDGLLIPLAFMMSGESGILREIRGIRYHGPSGSAEKCARRRIRRPSRRHLLTQDKGHRMEHRLKSMGFLPGTRIKIIRNDPGRPLIVRIGDCRVCVGRGIAMRVMVEKD